MSAEAAVGQTLFLQAKKPTEHYPATIVGVVGDVRFGNLHEPVRPIYYMHNTDSFNAITVRMTDTNQAVTVAAIKALYAKTFPGRPFQGGFVVDHLSGLYTAEILKARMFILFSGLAVVIACLGLFGLAAYTAESRQQEISVRRVFGANLSHIIKLLMRQFTWPILFATLIGWPIAWFAMHHWLMGFTKHIDTPIMLYIGASSCAIELAFITVVWHVWKIKRTDMTDTLRYE